MVERQTFTLETTDRNRWAVQSIISMPKTDINSILKNGNDTVIQYVDYTSPEAMEKLKALKKVRDRVLRNKEVNVYKLSKIIMTI